MIGKLAAVVTLLCLCAFFTTPLCGDDGPAAFEIGKSAGADDAQADLQRAKSYFQGADGYAKDEAQGLIWAKKAASLGNAEAAGIAGCAICDGLGTKPDPAGALQWFMQAAQEGDAFGQMWLGDYYRQGVVVAKDPQKAMKLFRKAAEGGNDRAITEIGRMYLDGEGVPKDNRKAFTYFLRAAYDDFSWAQWELAAMYNHGDFVSRNLVEEDRWGRLAYQNGYDFKGAKGTLVQLEKSMKPEQVKAAQALVQNWPQERVDLQAGLLPIDFGASHRAELPLQDFYSLPVVSVTLNGHPGLHFVIDTGSNASIIDSGTATAIHLAPSDQFRPADGVGPHFMPMPVSSPVELEMGGIRFSRVRFLETSTSAWNAAMGMHLDGIIGGDLLQHGVLHLDYIRQLVGLIDPATFRPNDASVASLSVTLAGFSPEVEARVINGGDSESLFLSLDTGADEDVSLKHDFVAANPDLHLDQGGSPTWFGGVGGSSRDFTHRLDQLSLGGIRVSNPFVEVAGKGGINALGEGILNRFDVTLDYPGRKLYLNLNAHFNEPFSDANNDLILFASGGDLRTIVIHAIEPTTAAAKSGLRSGDILTRIDEIPLAGKSLNFARRLLREHHPHKIVVLRDGQSLSFHFE